MIMQLPKEQQTLDVTSLASCLGTDAFGSKAGRQKQDWACCISPRVTQGAKKDPWFILPELQCPPSFFMVPFFTPKQTSSDQTSSLELAIIFCVIVSHFQVLYPSYKKLPFCMVSWLSNCPPAVVCLSLSCTLDFFVLFPLERSAVTSRLP